MTFSQTVHVRLRELQRYATLNNAVLAVALLIALGWIGGSVDALGRNYKYQQQVDAARAQNELLGLQNDTLKAEQSYLQTDEYLGLAARSKLNKALPGEKLLILPQITAAVPATASSSAVPRESNLAQWMDFLFGKRGS